MRLVRNETATATPTAKRLAEVEHFKTNQFSTFSFQLTANKASIRHDTMNGRDHLVVPCVMMTEGVHEGSQGPLFYPRAELSASPNVWNHKPVVVYHPERNGLAVSACDPDIITKYGVGVLMNTRWEKDGLRTECWLEQAKLETVDDRVINALEEGQMMEVSTGLFLDVENEEGEWNGESYKGIARNHKPDHLAILPDLKGACSIEDGAGLLRNEAKEENTPESLLAAHLLKTFNELSHSDIWKKLNDKIRGNNPDSDTYVVEVWDDFFIYEQGVKTFHQSYKLEDDEVKLEGVRQEATRVTRFQLADGTFVGNNQEDAMNEKAKAKLIAKIIANATTPWKEEDRETLTAMTDDHLTWIGNQEEPKPEEKPEPKPTDKVETKPEPKPTGNEQPKPITVEKYIEEAPEEMRDVLRAGLTAHYQRKAQVIQKITSNTRNPFTAEQLQAKNLDELEQLATLAETPPAPAVSSRPHFAGQAEPATVINTTVEEPLTAPTLNFDKDQ